MQMYKYKPLYKQCKYTNTTEMKHNEINKNKALEKYFVACAPLIKYIREKKIS